MAKAFVRLDPPDFAMKFTTEYSAKVSRSIRNALREIGMSGEAIMKRKATAKIYIGGKHLTNKYRSGLTPVYKPNKSMPTEVHIGPKVVYGGWVEDGADSEFAPAKGKGSDFRGHKVVADTYKDLRPKVSPIVRGHLRRNL